MSTEWERGNLRMIRRLSVALVIMNLILHTFLCADLKKKMLSDFDFIGHVFDVQYAPSEWKRTLFQWELNREVECARQKIIDMNPVTIEDYQKIVKDFVLSVNDYHVGVRFYSTESASLPFRMKGVEGHYFVTIVNSDRLSPYNIPILEGDEILMLDDRPVDEVVQEFRMGEIGISNDDTDLALAELFFCCRFGALRHEIPRGKLKVTIKSHMHNDIVSHDIPWDYYPEKVTNGSKIELSNKNTENFFHKSFVPHLHPFFEELSGKTVESPDDIGSRQSFVPCLGKVLWKTEPENPFDAYLFETPDGHTFGYVRIGNYHGMDREAEAFSHIISYLQETSEGLVIDQVNNPGGYALYLYALLSMLTDEPLRVPSHRIMLTQKEATNAYTTIQDLEKIDNEEGARLHLGNAVMGYSTSLHFAQDLLKYCRFIYQEWCQNNMFTDRTYLYGVEEIQPHPHVRYTKPIMVLINQLDFSGADFFPAILQDNQRALLFGMPTAGAGGYPVTVTYPNRFGIAYMSVTGSFAERPNLQPIENLGVQPDIRYEITQNDILSDFQDYAHKIIEVMREYLANP